MGKSVSDKLKEAPHGWYVIQLTERYKFMPEDKGLKVVDGVEDGQFQLRYRQITGESWNSTDIHFQLQIVPGLTCDIPYESVEKFRRINVYD